MAQVCLMRKEMRLDTASDGDEADHSSGDASEKGGRAVVQAYPSCSFSILKAGHHGSRTSKWRALLKLVQQTRVYIIGHNHYGHRAQRL